MHVHRMKQFLCLLTCLIVSINGQCDVSFPEQEISYISSNPSSSFVYNLGNQVSSATQCKNACQNINYLCDAKRKHSYSYMEDGGQWSHDANQCTVSIGDSGSAFGSFVLLTPNITSAEYIIDVNLRITNGYGDGGEGGLVFGASRASYPGAFFTISRFGDAIYNVGSLTSTPYYNWPKISTLSIPSLNVDYTIRVHKLSTGHWRAYLDGDLVFSSDSSSSSPMLDPSSFPDNYVGVYAWLGAVTFNSLRLSFSNSSEEETVCSGYQFDTATSVCSGYYGSDYAALYGSLSTNPNFDSGIISPTCQLTTAAPTTKTFPSSNKNETGERELRDLLLSIIIVLVSCGCFCAAVLLFAWSRYKRIEQEEIAQHVQPKSNVVSVAPGSMPQPPINQHPVLQVQPNPLYPPVPPPPPPQYIPNLAHQPGLPGAHLNGHDDQKYSKEAVELQFVYEPNRNYKREGSMASIVPPGINQHVIVGDAVNNDNGTTTSAHETSPRDQNNDEDEDIYIDIVNQPQTTRNTDNGPKQAARTLYM